MFSYSNPYTIESVRKLMPDVRLVVDGKKAIGYLYGPREPRAWVSYNNGQAHVEVDWGVIVKALNANRPIHVKMGEVVNG